MLKNTNTNFWALVIVFFCLVACSKCKGQTVEEVRSLIEAYGIEHAETVLAQSVLETGWYKCTSCSLDSNNLFGFLYKGSYLKFDTWQDSVKYYKWWQTQLYKDGDYYVFLNNIGYATSPNYIQTVKNVEHALSNMQ